MARNRIQTRNVVIVILALIIAFGIGYGVGTAVTLQLVGDSVSKLLNDPNAGQYFAKYLALRR